MQIVSDSICPYASIHPLSEIATHALLSQLLYIGYKQIQLAIQAAKKENLALDFKLRFKPFLLDPTLPMSHPINKREMYASKFGPSRVGAMEAMMKARGQEVGIKFSYSDGATIRQTTDSHRLIGKAYEVGGEPMQTAVVEALFSGYFEKERDVGNHDFLAEVAVSAGVFSKEDALAFLRGTEGKDTVNKEIREAQQLGVSGVPFVILDNKYAVSGAQGQETFLEIFRKVAAGASLSAGSAEGDVC
ncbi:DSBA-like thioredoxin domain-containing protein [Mycena rebaudengoi]|nr:DSBA-like thioredoxin domain-containing protein [Mycena rebaudengoi]